MVSKPSMTRGELDRMDQKGGGEERKVLREREEEGGGRRGRGRMSADRLGF